MGGWGEGVGKLTLTTISRFRCGFCVRLKKKHHPSTNINKFLFSFVTFFNFFARIFFENKTETKKKNKSLKKNETHIYIYIKEFIYIYFVK